MTGGRPSVAVVGLGTALALVAAALLLRGLSFAQAVIDIDEGLYMLQAREWLRGGWPYVAVWDMHPVGAPAIFALVMATLGETIWALRLAAALAVAAAAGALLAIARRLGLAAGPAWGAALLYVAATTLFGGLAANTEILMAPLTAWAIALGIGARDGAPSALRIAAMGTLIGGALLIKPLAVFEGSLAWLLAVLPAWRAGRMTTGRVALVAAGYAALCATPTLAVALAYAMHGAWAAFADAAIAAPLRYAGGRADTADTMRYVGAAILTVPVATSLAVLAWRGGARGRRQRALRRVASLWLLAAAGAIAAPGQYYPHYFLFALPPLCLLAALGARALARRLGARRIGAAVATLIALATLDAISRSAGPRLYNPAGLTAPDPVRQVAAEIAARIAPGDPVWVVNYPPVVHVLSGAGLATRYAFPAHLSGTHAALIGVDPDREIARILADRPPLVVVYRGWWQQIRPGIRPVLEDALARDYLLAAEIAEALGPVEIWQRR
jgi:4-amino-4-deoxy-L-arabinose transferase-like glycosyltransferase